MKNKKIGDPEADEEGNRPYHGGELYGAQIEVECDARAKQFNVVPQRELRDDAEDHVELEEAHGDDHEEREGEEDQQHQRKRRHL